MTLTAFFFFLVSVAAVFALLRQVTLRFFHEPLRADVAALATTIAFFAGILIAIPWRTEIRSMVITPQSSSVLSPAAPAAFEWRKRSSPFPMDLVPNGQAGWLMSGHPARREQTPRTVIEASVSGAKNVRVSGAVRFYTTSCKGAEILAGTDYGSGSPVKSAGVFLPRDNGKRFDVTIPVGGASTVYLDVTSNPKTPEDIDYCTLRVEDLRLAVVR
jgi:hypothetical protein